MNTPSQEDLLGYVLGALEAQEQSDVQQYIDKNPEVEDDLLELRNSMTPLDALDVFPKGQAGLARRTCELVANLDSRLDSSRLDSSRVDSSHTISPHPDLAGGVAEADEAREPVTPRSIFTLGRLADRLEHPATWSRYDLLAGIAFLAILSGILFPAISWSRFNSRVNACQSNMAHVGFAMLQFSDLHGQENIQIPGASQIAATNAFAPVLLEVGMVDGQSTFRCAGLVDEEAPRIPTPAQLVNAKGSQLSELYRRMGGHFGYALGYLDQKSRAWHAPRNDGSSHVVVIADRPSNELPGRKSINHSGRGQNLFFGDGHVSFVKGHTLGDDAIFENDMGIVGPGVGPQDNVIAPSHLAPVVFEIVKPVDVIQ